MADAKVEFSIGTVTFSSEGEKEWVEKQLDKILEKVPKLLMSAPVAMQPAIMLGTPHQPMQPSTEISKKTLPSFLSEKGATTNQVKRFLATSVWLEAKGQNRLETKDVASALRTANQSRLGNPSDCLNSNVKKGHCEKDGGKFFVTEEGKNSL